MGRRRRAGERTWKPGPRTRLQVVSSECLSERARDNPGPVPLPHRTGGRLRGTEERLLPSSLARKSARATLSRLHQDDSKVLHKEETNPRTYVKNSDIANKKNKKKIILIFISVEETNHPPNVNKTSAKAVHTEREVVHSTVVEQRMTGELLC